MSTPFGLDGEIALVTGGGTGLGFGIAKALLDAGARVVVTGRRREQLESAAASLGAGAIAMPGDVSQPGDRARWLAQTRAQLGEPISILVNNAGTHLKKPALETSDSEFREVMDIHVTAAFALSREVAAPMLEAGHGSILFIASMASYLSVPRIAAYTAAKCAVVGLTRALAAEWSEQGVRVNAIAPGWISSPMTDKAFAGDPERKAKVLGRTPMKRLGEAADIGMAAVYLCSPSAAFVTGQTFPIDGGAAAGF